MNPYLVGEPEVLRYRVAGDEEYVLFRQIFNWKVTRGPVNGFAFDEAY